MLTTVKVWLLLKGCHVDGPARRRGAPKGKRQAARARARASRPAQFHSRTRPILALPSAVCCPAQRSNTHVTPPTGPAKRDTMRVYELYALGKLHRYFTREIPDCFENSLYPVSHPRGPHLENERQHIQHLKAVVLHTSPQPFIVALNETPARAFKGHAAMSHLGKVFCCCRPGVCHVEFLEHLPVEGAHDTHTRAHSATTCARHHRAVPTLGKSLPSILGEDGVCAVGRHVPGPGALRRPSNRDEVAAPEGVVMVSVWRGLFV